MTGEPPFPEDAPEDFDELVSPEYDEWEFDRLHRDISDEHYGGATWRSASGDKTVEVCDLASCGWSVKECETVLFYDETFDCQGSKLKSSKSVSDLSREEAYRLADDYMKGDAELEESEDQQRSGQQTLNQIATDGGNARSVDTETDREVSR